MNTGSALVSKAICKVNQRQCNYGARKPTLEGGIFRRTAELLTMYRVPLHRKCRCHLYTPLLLLSRVRAGGLTLWENLLIPKARGTNS